MLDAALRRVDGRAAVAAALTRAAAGARAAPPARPRRHALIAIGKAAPTMLEGAREVLGASIECEFLVTKAGQGALQLAAPATLERHESAHPVPDERSLQAGERLLEWIASLPRELEVIVLVSGGASSLVEVPRAGVTLAQLRELNERGLREGIDIGQLNAARARLSRLKGGGLSAALAGRGARALFLSDVPGDDPAVIGSGLAGPAPGDDLRREVVASLDEALAAAVARARALGLEVGRLPQRLAGEAETAAAAFVARLREAAAPVLVGGGESVVRLPAAPGRGGRNQHLALAAALGIAGDPALVVMAAGSDGDDGSGGDAGGVVDGGTTRRIEDAGLDPRQALRDADSGPALEAAGDLVHTGPTGTNVGDLLLGLRLTETQAADLLALHGEPRPPVL